MHADWRQLTNNAEVDALANASGLSLILKHSTTCSISSVALNRLERRIEELKSVMPIYYLDLLAYRSVSNYIAEKFQVHHESPQALLIQNGECIYESTHMDIIVDDLLEQVQLAS
jgi:bacillithiol system protein YtxJ